MTRKNVLKLLSFATVLFYVVILSSCKKEEIVGPQGPAGPAGNSPIFTSKVGTGSLIADNTVLNYTQIPGLLATIVVPTDSVNTVLVQTDGGIQLNSSDPTASGFTDIAIFINNQQIGSGRRIPVLNSNNLVYSVGAYSFSIETSLSAGTYTIKVMAKKYSSMFSDCYVSSDADGSILGGNPNLQGILTITQFP